MIEKSALKVTLWYHEACQVMTNRDPDGPIFLFLTHTNSRLSCPSLNAIFTFLKWLPDVSKYAEMQQNTMTPL